MKHRPMILAGLALLTMLTACDTSSQPSVTTAPPPSTTSTTSTIATTIAPTTTTLAPTPEVVFEAELGGGGMDRGVSVAETSDGGLVVVGVTDGFGAGGDDALLIRLDAAGTELWSHAYGGSADDAGWSVVETAEGGFVVAGFTSSFGARGVDVYLFGVDAEGELLWETTHGGEGDDYGWGIQPAADGFVVVAETTSVGAGGIDGWLVAVDDSGMERWSQTYGGARDDRLFALHSTADGGWVAAGVTESSGAGGRDAWVVKTDADGVAAWERTVGDSGDDVAHSVDLTADGGIAVFGYSDGFDSDGYDVLVVKLGADGDTEWSTMFGGGAEDRVISGEETARGGFILAGYTRSSGAGSLDAYVVETDSSGAPLWSATFGGPTADVGYTIVETSDGGYVLVGHVSNGGESTRDVLVVRLAGE